MNNAQIIEELLIPLNESYTKNKDSDTARKICELVETRLRGEEQEERIAEHFGRYGPKFLVVAIISLLGAYFVYKHGFEKSELSNVMTGVVSFLLFMITGQVLIDVFSFERDDTSVFAVYRQTKKEVHLIIVAEKEEEERRELNRKFGVVN